MRVTSCVLALVFTAVAASASAASDDAAGAGPAQVRVVEDAGAWRLTVDGVPFRIRGAGLSGGDIEALAQRGGNAFRTWSTGLDCARVTGMLDRAHRNGLRVAMGLEIGKERHGFDYDDPAAVAAQLARIREEVAA